MDAIARALRAPAPDETPSLAAWLDRCAAETATAPFERAVRLGAQADRLGYAFVAGYHAALVALVARAGVTRPFGARMCLAVTEEGGGHPRAIATRLTRDGGRLVLSGRKTFATLASVADDILVLASAGDDGERKDLRLVRVRAGDVHAEDRAPLPFAPEVPHARLTFDALAVADDDVLPGDGFTRYVRPFRTIEDVHVLAAAIAHLAPLARRTSRSAELEEIALVLTGLETLARSDPEAPAVHLALAAAFTRAATVLGALGGEDARLARDLPLLAVAGAARAKRTAAAAASLASIS